MNDIRLIDEEDFIIVELADGSYLHIAGDGLVGLFLDPEDDDPVTFLNLYAPDEEVSW